MHAPFPPAPRASFRFAAPALSVAIIAAATIAAVHGLQHAGYAPCELCLRERIPFYWGCPLALLVAAIAWRGRPSLLPAAYVALGLVFLAGAGLGLYHAGVEWRFWPGPSSCTGGLDHPAAVDDFLKQLQVTQVVQCDAPALRVAGLSLAAWNAVVCMALAALSALGFARSDRRRS